MLRKIAFYIIPVSILFDISLLFYEGGVIPIVKAFLMLSYLIALLFGYKDNIKYFKWIIIFCLYVLFTVVFSSDNLTSLAISLKVIISISSFIIGFNLINNIRYLIKLNHSIVYALLILLGNFVISQKLGLGVATYTEGEEFLTGNLSGWDLYTYSILITPLILLFLNKKNKKRYVVLLLAFANSILIALSIKRISIAVLIGGLGINSIVNYKLGSIFRSLIIIVIMGAMSYPLFEDILDSRLSARADRFEEGALEKEDRYRETFFVWDEILSFRNPLKSMFGLEGFNSVGNYASGEFGLRQLHVDYNLIANTIGLVGLTLYFIMFYKIYQLFTLAYRYCPLPITIKKQLLGTFYSLFVMQFITSLSGQMYNISFRMIIFIYLGAIIRVLNTYKEIAVIKNGR